MRKRSSLCEELDPVGSDAQVKSEHEYKQEGWCSTLDDLIGNPRMNW